MGDCKQNAPDSDCRPGVAEEEQRRMGEEQGSRGLSLGEWKVAWGTQDLGG